MTAKELAAHTNLTLGMLQDDLQIKSREDLLYAVQICREHLAKINRILDTMFEDLEKELEDEHLNRGTV